MPCGSCIDKLAYKLMANHKVDMIRAYELAEKGVERVENRNVATAVVKSGNPTDYTQTCTVTGSPSCRPTSTICETSTDCLLGVGTCACGCPAPLSNSHKISDCSAFPIYNCPCTKLKCAAVGTCTGCAGTCGYDCDSGYVWNPSTLQCVQRKRLLVGVGL